MPRPRFTLRAVLAVTAIVAVVAWQYSIVLKRNETLSSVRSISVDGMERRSEEWTSKNHRPVHAPNFLRRILGDEDFALVQIQPSCTDDELERIAELFPKAAVQRSLFAW